MSEKMYLTDVAVMCYENTEEEQIAYILEGNRTGSTPHHLEAIKDLVIQLRATFLRRRYHVSTILTLDNEDESARIYAMEAIHMLREYGTCEAILNAEPRRTPRGWRDFVAETWLAYHEEYPTRHFTEFVFDLFAVNEEEREQYLDDDRNPVWVADLLKDVLYAAKQFERPLGDYWIHSVYGIARVPEEERRNGLGASTSTKRMLNMPDSVVSLFIVRDYDDLYQLCFALEALVTRLAFGYSPK